MLSGFSNILEQAKGSHKRIAVACAADQDVIYAIGRAQQLGIAQGILIGDKPLILSILEQLQIDPQHHEIIHAEDDPTACQLAADQIKNGTADIMMKGHTDTSNVLRAVLKRENMIRGSGKLSHVGIFELPHYERVIYVTDAGMNIAPDLEMKKAIIENTVELAQAMGNKTPNVAVLSAIEKVNPAIPSSVDAAQLTQYFKGNPNCNVGGPYGLDNAISPESAAHKGMSDPLAGHADILLVPNIESGNILYKSLCYFAQAQNAGLILGSQVPIIVTSRSDHSSAKLNSIAIAALLSTKQQHNWQQGAQCA